MKNAKCNSKEIHQEKMINKALRTGGFIFPETIDEVKEFERIYGKTDVILPAELQEPDFLYSKSKEKGHPKVANLDSENLAMAARKGINQLPEEIISKMKKDRKRVEAKRKRKK